jgi:rubrerythrin
MIRTDRLVGRCDECGYDLTGLHSQTCPECGAVVDQGAGASD